MTAFIIEHGGYGWIDYFVNHPIPYDVAYWQDAYQFLTISEAREFIKRFGIEEATIFVITLAPIESWTP